MGKNTKKSNKVVRLTILLHLTKSVIGWFLLFIFISTAARIGIYFGFFEYYFFFLCMGGLGLLIFFKIVFFMYTELDLIKSGPEKREKRENHEVYNVINHYVISNDMIGGGGRNKNCRQRKIR